MMLDRRLYSVIFALTLAVASVPSRMLAQDPFEIPTDPGSRIQVTLVLTGTGQSPALLRRSGDDARDVVLLNPARLDPQQLSDAVFQLLVLEAQDPDGQRRTRNTAQRVRADVPHPVYPWAEEAIRRLRTAPVRSIPGLTGNRQARTLDLWLRPLRGVSKQQAD